MAHVDGWEGKWRGNWRMERVASTLHTTSEHDVSNNTTADAHSSVASSRLNWSPRRFKWTRPFRRKTKSGFCVCAITFQTQSTPLERPFKLSRNLRHLKNLCPYIVHSRTAQICAHIFYTAGRHKSVPIYSTQQDGTNLCPYILHSRTAQICAHIFYTAGRHKSVPIYSTQQDGTNLGPYILHSRTAQIWAHIFYTAGRHKSPPI